MSQPSDIEAQYAAALGAHLRALRESRGLTQENLAHQADLNRNHYQKLEQGLSSSGKRPANPTLTTLMSLARVHQTTPSALLDAATQAVTARSG